MKRFFGLVGRAKPAIDQEPSPQTTPTPNEKFTPPPPPPISTSKSNPSSVKAAIEKFERQGSGDDSGTEDRDKTVKIEKKGGIKTNRDGAKDVRTVAFATQEQEPLSFPLASTSSAPNRSISPTYSFGHTNGSVSSHLPPHLQQLPFRPSSSQSAAYTFSNHGQFSPDLLLASGASGRDPTTIYAPVTWTEMINDSGRDLTENISGRERTRQEVLWEIVASEERYVQELISLRDHYVEPLLHPLRTLTSPPSPQNQFSRSTPTQSPEPVTGEFTSPSSDFLPIAAKFLRRTDSIGQRSVESGRSEHDVPSIPDYSEDNHDPESSSQGHGGNGTPSTTGPTGAKRFLKNGVFGFGDKSPKPSPSLPSLPRAGTGTGTEEGFPVSSSVADLSKRGQQSMMASFRHHLRPPPASKKLHKSKTTAPPEALHPATLPIELRKILETIGDGLVKGHFDLNTRLKEKYSEQWPLVRSLASSWTDQDWILKEYAVYVVNLERALEEVQAALDAVAAKGKDPEVKRLGRTIMKLEEKASLNGESGLAICLSKPFQRLLKYPLLFQNLLYHTDPSTHEYESARTMAIEIDALVRSIEDEKVSEEEREKTRDVFARIENIKDKALMAPRSSRCLIDEVSLYKPPAKRTMSDAPRPTNLQPDDINTLRQKALKDEKTSRRRSDMTSADGKVPSLGSKKDIWLVIFSDVVIRCQRVGVTVLSGAALANSKSPKSGGGRKTLPGRQRNLYKFIQVESWEKRSLPTTSDAKLKAGMVSMDDIARTRGPGISTLARQQETDEESEVDSEEFILNGGGSRMSFSYAADDPRPNLSEPILLSHRNGTPTEPKSSALGTRSASATTQHVVTKSNPAAAKFGTRLRPSDPASASGGVTNRPSSRARQGGFAAHTASSAAKQPPPALNRAMSPLLQAAQPKSRSGTPPRSPVGASRRAASSNETAGAVVMTPPVRAATTNPSRIGTESNSGLFLYKTYWDGKDDDPTMESPLQYSGQQKAQKV